MSELFEKMKEKSKEAPKVNDENIGKIANLAQKQIDIEQDIMDAQEKLKKSQEDLKDIQEDLVSAMDEAGMRSFTTKDGNAIEVIDFVAASIKADDKDEAYAWLEQNGHEDLIKHEIKLTFKKGENDKAEKALKALKDQGFDPEDKESVHAGTLKSFCKEQIEQGKPIPLDLFGVFQGRKSVIK